MGQTIVAAAAADGLLAFVAAIVVATLCDTFNARVAYTIRQNFNCQNGKQIECT